MPAYKDEKRNTWYCQFWYVDWQGTRRHKVKRGFKTKREAKDYENKFKDTSKTNIDISFSSLYENYKEQKMSVLKESTQENKTNIIEKHILPYFKKRKVSEINSQDIMKWQNEIRKSSYSDTYLKSINNQLSTLFNYAVRHYGLSINPCVIAGSMGSKKTDEEMKFWTLDEFNKFISCVGGLANQLAFKILYWCGLRKGELLALTPADILPSKEISINKTGRWKITKDKKEFIVTTPKTRKSIRKVSIPEFLYNEVKLYISKLYGIKNNDLIFPYESNNTLNGILDRGIKKSGVKRIRVHDLRHSHASLCIELGMNILLISERLGHENIETTLNTYSHLYPNKQAALANQLNELATKQHNN